METKWTPGPWDSVNPFGGVVKGGVRYPLPVNEDRQPGESWLEMRNRTEPERLQRHEEAEANIALQLAAPDLYEALDRLLGPALFGSQDDAELLRDWGALGMSHIDAARAALAKARGECRMIDVSDTIAPKSDQLNADDVLSSDKVITVTAVRLYDSDQQPVFIHYEGDDGRPYKPCKSMRRVLIAAWGKDASDWIGRSMRLYGDPEVTFGGSKVGGIRISHLTDIDGPQSYMLTVTRGKRAEYRVKPMDTPQRKPISDDLFASKLPAVRELIVAGKLTPEQAIASFQANYGEPNETQRAAIRA